MKQEIVERIQKSLLLTGVVFVAHHFSGFLEEMVMQGIRAAWIYLFIWYSGFIFLFLSFYPKKKKK